jgi:hypothetical protein
MKDETERSVGKPNNPGPAHSAEFAVLLGDAQLKARKRKDGQIGMPASLHRQPLWSQRHQSEILERIAA